MRMLFLEVDTESTWSVASLGPAFLGGMLRALQYGAPPHGGIAFGLDRLVMHIVGTDNIRDVIAFPKTQSGADLMTDAPGPVDPAQLVETHVRSTAPEQPARS